MGMQKKGKMIFQSVLTGIGIAVFFLLIGTVLDYVMTQILSQFFIANCSEDCYFRYFNAIFIFVALLSVAGGVFSGIRSYKRLSENPK